MDTTVSVFGTVAVVAVGQWQQDKHISMKYVVGSGVYALSVALLGNSHQKLAEQLALLVFVSAVLMYGVQIAVGFGLIEQPRGGLAKLPRTQNT